MTETYPRVPGHKGVAETSRRSAAAVAPAAKATRENALAAYPNAPGVKECNGTSQQAADQAKPFDEANRELVLRALREHGPMTADEVGKAIGLEPLQVRPRVAQLFKLGKVTKTGAKGPSASGNPSWVWRAVERRVQQEMFST